jgi:anthranilate phosphoribosyltransferase
MFRQENFFVTSMEKVFLGTRLNSDEIRQLMDGLLHANLSDARVAALLTALRLSTITQELILSSLESFKQSLKQFSGIDLSETRVVDNSGTGGGQSATYNISSMSAVLAAAAGACIAKFGSRSLSGHCGSADVLESLGIPFAKKPEQFQRQLKEVGISYLYAPALIPPLQHINVVRRSLGFHTILDLLLPLANPAPLYGQVLGVYSEDVQILAARCLNALGRQRALVVHSEDGLDEISVSRPTRIVRLVDGHQSAEVWRPEDFGLKLYEKHALVGGGMEENTQCFRNVLAGHADGAVTDAVILNAAATLWCAAVVDTVHDGVSLAQETLRSGRAEQKLKQWKESALEPKDH